MRYPLLSRQLTGQLLTFWKRDTMSPAMVLTRAVISSMKRSGKRFFLGDSRRSVKYRWWIMLLTCGKGRFPCERYKTFPPTCMRPGCFRCKRVVSYHEFKEKPGLLESALPDAAAAHHPLEGQLLVEELSRAAKKETEREGSGDSRE